MNFNIKETPWVILDDITCDEFILEMLKHGKPTETSLVGAFEDVGRGSLRDVDLPMHKDGDYSRRAAEKNGKEFSKIADIVGLYCIREGTTSTQIQVDGENEVSSVVLKKGQALIFDNNKCLHGRKGPVGDRVLLRIWIDSF